MFYKDMFRTMYDLPDDKLVVLFKALAEAVLFERYKESADEMANDPVLFAVYEGFTHRIFDDSQRYEEICETRAANRKGKTKENKKTNEN